MDQKIILDVSSILSSEIGTSQSFSVKEKIRELDKEVKLIDDLQGKVTLNHFEENQLLSFFDLQTTLGIVCARCLKRFKMPLKLNYEQIFATKSNEDSFLIMGNRTIDVFPSIRQEILLSVPIKPICSQKCKGVKRGRT